MKKLSLVIALLLLAMPAFAQDEIVLSNSDIDALMGGGANRGGRGGRGNQNQPQIPDPIVWFADIKALLKDNKVALDKNQEKALQAFLDKETVAMRTELEAGFARGRGNNNSAQMNMLTDLTAALTKHNTEFLTEVKANLAPDQASLITKAENDKKVCSVALDLVNFQGVRTRTQQQNNNFRGNQGGGGLSDDLSELLGLPTGGGAANRGTQNNQTAQFLQLIPDRVTCVQSNSTTAQRLAVLGDILTKGKKPFTPEQTTKVSALIEARMKVITDELKAKYNNLDTMLNSLNQINNNNNQNQNRGNQNQNQTQTPPAAPTVNIATLTNNIVNTIMQNLGIQNPQNNNNNNNNNNNQGGGGRGGRGGGGGGNFPEGGRGGGGGNFTFPEGGRGGNAAAPANANAQNRGNNNTNFNPQQEIQTKTDELYDKVAATLTPEQAKLVKKVKYDQMKARGPVDRYRAILEMEGTPLTPEQVTQIQTMLTTQNTAIRAAATTLVQKEIQALDPGAMQAVINEYLAQQAQQTQQQQNPQQNSRNNNNNNVNSVAQNRVAQQIIQKMLPEVSKQKALLEGATNAQIQTRVFTPQQVASYKLASMQ
jgi:hypothetical protein